MRVLIPSSYLRRFKACDFKEDSAASCLEFLNNFPDFLDPSYKAPEWSNSKWTGEKTSITPRAVLSAHTHARALVIFQRIYIHAFPNPNRYGYTPAFICSL